jgi:hypothetical protein
MFRIMTDRHSASDTSDNGCLGRMLLKTSLIPHSRIAAATNGRCPTGRAAVSRVSKSELVWDALDMKADHPAALNLQDRN